MRERQSTSTFTAVLRLGLRLHLKRTHVAHRGYARRSLGN